LRPSFERSIQFAGAPRSRAPGLLQHSLLARAATWLECRPRRSASA
jgi:hypothetical protein